MNQPDEFEQAALIVTLKAGTGFDAPWIVVRASTPADLVQRLDALHGFAISAKTAEAAAALQAQYVVATGLGGQAVPPPAQQAPPTAWQAPPTSPAPAASAPPVQAAPGLAPIGANGAPFEKQDRYGNRFVYNDPTAPLTVRGPMVKATRQKKAGGTYTMWIDPAHKAAPLWREQGNPQFDQSQISPDQWVDK